MGVRRRELPKWLWLWLPLASLVVMLATRAASMRLFTIWFRCEIGLIEVLTPVWALAGAVAGVLILRHRSTLPRRWLTPWVALLTLGCIYFAGEETSWGQHYVKGRTPQAFESANDQGETNLHNLHRVGSYLDQAPRNLLMVAAIVGGILAPLIRRLRGRSDGWLWPTVICTPTAILALSVRLPDRVAFALAGEPRKVLPLPIGEVEEFYLAGFLALYLLALRARLAVARRHQPIAGAY